MRRPKGNNVFSSRDGTGTPPRVFPGAIVFSGPSHDLTYTHSRPPQGLSCEPIMDSTSPCGFPCVIYLYPMTKLTVAADKSETVADLPAACASEDAAVAFIEAQR